MIDSDTWQALRRIGLSPLQALSLWNEQPAADAQAMRVVEVQRGGVLTLHDGIAPQPARRHPALAQHLAADDEALAVGDWVWAVPDGQGTWWARHCVPRSTALTRRVNDGDGGLRRQTLVANIDTAFLVMGLDHDFNLRRLERYLALVRMAGVEAVVVLSKADLAEVATRERRLREASSAVPAGMAVFAVCGPSAESAAVLQPWLSPGQTVVLLGSSGAGKSTLTNTLCAEALQDTGGVRSGDSRGRHTTTVRSLHCSPSGACIIDTPGLRALRLDADDASSVTQAFDDIREAAHRCRFRDCRHEDEPGCAVRESVSAERVRNFHKLQREAQRDSMTLLQKREQRSEWKARSRHAAARLQAKRG